MKTFTCIVVDDDSFATQQIAEYIAEIPYLKLIGIFTDSAKALQALLQLEHPVDFLFTDIEMPRLNGFELAKLSSSKFKNLVLASSHLNYAPEGFSFFARDFLTKPFDFKKFNVSVKRIIDSFTSENPFITIKLKKKNEIKRLYTKDIIAIEGASNYIKIHTIDKVYVPYYKLSDIELDLSSDEDFIRINRSNIISKRHIVGANGYSVEMRNSLNFVVASSYRKTFDKSILNLIS